VALGVKRKSHGEEERREETMRKEEKGMEDKRGSGIR